MEYLAGDKTVLVKVRAKDRYGRVVANLFVDNEDLGLTMVSEGKAIVYEQYNNSQTYRNAQAQANCRWAPIASSD